jgi:hypothetical protein
MALPIPPVADAEAVLRVLVLGPLFGVALGALKLLARRLT